MTKPELGPTFLSSNLLYAGLLGCIFMASVFLTVIMFDSGLSNIYHGGYTIGGGLMLLGLVVFIIGGGIFFPAAMQLWDAIQLERRGEIISAEIIEKRLEKDKKGRHYCFIVYAYDENFTIKQAIPQGQYQSLKIGDQVNVRCLPGASEIARLER